MAAARGWFGIAVVLAGFACVDARADALYDECSAADALSNPALAECGAQWVEREDAKLNAAWTRLQASFAAQSRDGAAFGQTRRDLLAEQRAWVAYQETACTFWTNGEWGRDGQVVHYFACQASLIAERTQQLELLHDQLMQ